MFLTKALGFSGIALALLLCGCGAGQDTGTGQGSAAKTPTPLPAMTLTSTAFENEAEIPFLYTYLMQNISPPLAWSGVPEGTQSFALICEDPDAPEVTWNHWVIFNIPGDKRELPEDIPRKKELPNGTRQGINSFGDVGYWGPQPPEGELHRYVFKVHAVDTILDVKAGSTKAQLLKGAEGHLLAEGRLMGVFGTGPDPQPPEKKAE